MSTNGPYTPAEMEARTYGVEARFRSGFRRTAEALQDARGQIAALQVQLAREQDLRSNEIRARNTLDAEVRNLRIANDIMKKDLPGAEADRDRYRAQIQADTYALSQALHWATILPAVATLPKPSAAVVELIRQRDNLQRQAVDKMTEVYGQGQESACNDVRPLLVKAQDLVDEHTCRHCPGCEYLHDDEARGLGAANSLLLQALEVVGSKP